MYLIKSPLLLKWYYPSLTWHKSRDQKVIYLTFDDGPIPDVTDFALKTLKSFNAKATFFCIGDNIHKHPDIFEKIKNDGHRIGNHTFNHLKGWKTPDEIYTKNFQKCQEITNTNLFRPPYGKISLFQARHLRAAMKGRKPKVIMWDVLSADFDKRITKEQSLQFVILRSLPGSIVVFHDSEKASEKLYYALPKVLHHFSKKGFRFLSL